MKIQRMKRLTSISELNIAFFAFLLNFAWEVLQTPFFLDISDKIKTIIWYRFHCTLGDVMISLGSFWLVALISKSRIWFLNLTKGKLLLFVAFGVSYTIFSEIKNVSLNKLWAYSDLMPVIPYIDVGIVPLIQWIIIPPILVFIIRKQLS
ncbi:MAG TPA: hypothetical protein ENI18_05820 [Candidatus Aminicenantes bacterium]|nr:hypothetical protein [Candidatus Aminicenantes bacterium]